MIDVSSMNSFRKLMLLDLHQRRLHPLPPKGIQLEHYYAVDSVSNHIGRVLPQNQDFVTLKFLHRTGASCFNWPRTDDIDEVHVSCLFYKPIHLKNSGPFHVPQQKEIEQLFKKLKRDRKTNV